jgi:hypothetical protein
MSQHDNRQQPLALADLGSILSEAPVAERDRISNDEVDQADAASRSPVVAERRLQAPDTHFEIHNRGDEQRLQSCGVKLDCGWLPPQLRQPLAEHLGLVGQDGHVLQTKTGRQASQRESSDLGQRAPRKERHLIRLRESSEKFLLSDLTSHVQSGFPPW